ncbi:MAG: PBSX family phage terminase large subunit [Candidatus Saccharimonadales bacterium]
MYSATTATKKILGLHARIQGVAGGTSASKTISNLLKLIQLSQTDKTPKLTSVVSESMPHLKRGAMRDFLNIMQAHNYYKEDNWNRTESIYTFETGSRMEFFSADSPEKTRGPRRDRLFINEGNNVAWEAADQMITRTKELIIIDWNPTNEFWWYTEIMPRLHNEELAKASKDIQFITLTYKDNEALDPAIVAEIEAHKGNKAWWQVYGLGQLGEVEGKIFTGWLTDLEDVPHEAQLVRRGLDFGYSNDPAVLTDIYSYNGGYILDEVFYRKGMHNKDIADMINNLPHPQTLVVADSAEPKSIAEISGFGVNIIGVQKRPGYLKRTTENTDIDYIQTQRISVTKRSTNLIKSYRNFLWKTDRDGKILNDYDHFWSDGMMSVIYGMSSLRPTVDDGKVVKTGNLSTLYAR